MLYIPCRESVLEVSKFHAKFRFRAGEIKLVDFFAKIDLIRKTNPRTFKISLESPCRLKMRVGCTLSCGHNFLILLDFCVHSLLIAIAFPCHPTIRNNTTAQIKKNNDNSNEICRRVTLNCEKPLIYLIDK